MAKEKKNREIKAPSTPLAVCTVVVLFLLIIIGIKTLIEHLAG